MPNDDREPGMHTIRLLIGLVAACALATGAAIFLIPPRFETHPEAIGYVLDQHGIAHGEITLQRAWPDTLSRSMYSADVIVQLRDASQISGRIECQVERSQCSLYLRRLGIWHAPVPDLAATPPWLADLQRYLSTALRQASLR
jgi:hypothetical protein